MWLIEIRVFGSTIAGVPAIFFFKNFFNGVSVPYAVSPLRGNAPVPQDLKLCGALNHFRSDVT